MAEKYVIVLGDKTSHGGTVVTGDDVLFICDKPAACLGDKVICPQHGETQIIEGFHTIMINDGKTLAYDGCQTSCGAYLIASGQDVVSIETESVECLVAVPEQIKTLPQDEQSEKSDEEFILFVATVWGEVASQSTVAWKAVGSVIMNRVGHPYWQGGGRNKTVTDVIKRTGFDAAKGEKQFLIVRKYLSAHQEQSELNQFEKKLINEMVVDLQPIYYEKLRTTDANYYYSPRAQAHFHKLFPKKYKAVPDFVNEPGVEVITVSGLKISDDLRFYRRS